MKFRLVLAWIGSTGILLFAGVASPALAQEATPAPADHSAHHPAQSAEAITVTAGVTVTAPVTLTTSTADGQPAAPDMGAMHDHVMGMLGDMATLKGMATTPEMKALMADMDGRMQGMMNGLMRGELEPGALHEEMQAMLDGMDKLMTMDLTSEQQTQMHKVHTELKDMMAEMMGAGAPSAAAADAPGGRAAWA